jgi:hypothetical protein
LTSAEAGGVSIIHELLHIVDAVPSDSASRFQSKLNTLLVKLLCVTLPKSQNAPLAEGPPIINTNPIPLRPGTAGGDGGPGALLNGGRDPFDSFRWLDRLIAASQTGGYTEVVGYRVNAPSQ